MSKSAKKRQKQKAKKKVCWALPLHPVYSPKLAQSVSERSVHYFWGALSHFCHQRRERNRWHACAVQAESCQLECS